jgi:DNA polymerase
MAERPADEYGAALDALRARLELEQWFGESHLPLTAARDAGRMMSQIRSRPAAQPPISAAHAKPEVQHPQARRSSPAALEKAAKLAELEQVVLQCARCPLKKTRTNLVFGEGNPDAEIMFVGEAPGRDEDLQGRPFVGKAGQLLTRIIQAMGMRREDVYIANVLKCRPPENRTPNLTEITCCARCVFQQIKIIQPKVVVGLGNIAVKSLLNTDESISTLRGKLHDFDGIKLMPTYHPAFLLRSPAYKSEVWDDMKKVLAYLGKPIPKSRAGG